MEKIIYEVQQYFKNKILKGEFEFAHPDEHRVSIIVDQKYPFSFWTSNGPGMFFRQDSLGKSTNFILIGDLTDDEKFTLWQLFEVYIKDGKEIRKKELNEQIQRLQEKLKNL